MPVSGPVFLKQHIAKSCEMVSGSGRLFDEHSPDMKRKHQRCFSHIQGVSVCDYLGVDTCVLRVAMENV